MSIIEFLEARIAEDEELANACNPGPWFYNGYAAVFSQPMLAPHDKWEDHAFEDGHSLEKRASCAACGKGHCELYATDYKMDPLIFGVAAQYGDTATGKRVFDARHVETWDPARVLAECAAKRAIMAHHTTHTYTDEEPGFSMELWDCMCNRQTMKPCPTVAALAAVYKDHPDYQQEWA